jgi:hypothetical protein
MSDLKTRENAVRRRIAAHGLRLFQSRETKTGLPLYLLMRPAGGNQTLKLVFGPDADLRQVEEELDRLDTEAAVTKEHRRAQLRALMAERRNG